MSRDLFRFRDLLLRRRSSTSDALPPRQCEISTFPRYGGDLGRRDPAVPARAVIELGGVGLEAAELDVSALRRLPRTQLVADFHCVAGWTTRDLHWEGVRFRDLYETMTAPGARPPTGASHVRAVGRDGFRAVLTLEDALADDVLIADRLDGAPLPVEHGGPARLVSASQYGYKSVKHVCRIELHAGEPSDDHLHRGTRLLVKVVEMHPRARVAHEERRQALPAWSVRWAYRRIFHPVLYVLGYLGARRMLPRRRSRPD